MESLGIPLPGETALVLASIYAGITHRLSPWLIFAAAAAGAVGRFVSVLRTYAAFLAGTKRQLAFRFSQLIISWYDLFIHRDVNRGSAPLQAALFRRHR